MGAEGEVKVVITGEQTVTPAAEGSASAIKELSSKTEGGATAAEGFNLKHREMRELLHLIARESGPEAALAMDGLALAATGGMFAGVMAVEQLFNWLQQLQAEADAAAEKIRTRITESVDVITQAKQAINDLGTANSNFWEKLATSSANAEAKSGFALLLQHIKDPATQIALRDARANGLQENIDSLSTQLKSLQSSETSGPALKAEADLILAKKELAEAVEALKKNKSFSTTSAVFANSGFGPSIGIHPNESPGNIETIMTVMNQAIATAEEQNKTVANHQRLLEQTIDQMTKEKDALTGKNNSARSGIDVDLLSSAESMAKDGPKNQFEQQFILRMADAASGHALNLQQAEQYLMQLEKTPAMLESVLTRLMHYNESVQRQLQNLHTRIDGVTQMSRNAWTG